MKRTLLVLISILIGVFIIFSLLGDKQYPAEKALYRINKKFMRIKEDPLATPDGRYKEVVEQYKNFIKKYPDSGLAPFAQVLIGRTYLMKNDYEMARSTFERIVQQYSKDKPNMAAQGLLEIAETYQQEQKVDGLVKTYERLKRDFPLTSQGLAAPVMLAKLLSTSKEPGAADAYNNAIKYYRQLMLTQGKSRVSFTALNYIAGCQSAQKNWQQAVNAYAEILLDYTDAPFMNQESVMFIIKAINTFSIGQLGNYELPVSIYNKFITTYPKHPLSPVLKQMIEGIHQLKEEQAKEQAKKAQQALPTQQAKPQEKVPAAQ